MTRRHETLRLVRAQGYRDERADPSSPGERGVPYVLLSPEATVYLLGVRQARADRLISRELQALPTATEVRR